MNVTRGKMEKNRDKINKLISSLRSIMASVINVTEKLDRQVSQLEVLTHRYWLHKMMVDILKKYSLSVHLLVNRLDLQLNSLSVGHLSPSIITPHKLRELLYSIAQALPGSFRLTSDPERDIWHYYRILHCAMLFDSRSVVIVVEVVLLGGDHSYIVYRLLNFLLQFPTSPEDKGKPRLLAKFELESEMIAVNRTGILYILLDHTEAAQC